MRGGVRHPLYSNILSFMASMTEGSQPRNWENWLEAFKSADLGAGEMAQPLRVRTALVETPG